MLYWSLVFLIMAMIAAILTYGSPLPPDAIVITRILFWLMYTMFLISLVLGFKKRR